MPLGVLALAAYGPAPARPAAGPAVTSSLTIPIDADVEFPPKPGETVHLAGQALITSTATVGAETFTVRLTVQLLRVRGTGSLTGAPYTATGNGSRQFTFPEATSVPPGGVGPFVTTYRLLCTDRTQGDASARFARLRLTLTPALDGDGYLTGATAELKTDPVR